jgi:hypothetical protein
LVLLLLGAVPGVAAQKAYRAPTRNPHGPLKMPCENCHTFTSWKPIRNVPEFDHNKTRFPLRGMHEKVECRSCHVKLVFTDVGTKCEDCHADIHRGQMGAKCEECHTVKGWDVSRQAVKEHQNRFPLLGAHATVECSACHTGAAVGQFAGLSTDCASCHITEYQNTKFIDHRALGFPVTCDNCHSVDTWFDAKFDHSKTGFALVGAHATLPCTACHVGGQFTGAPIDCYGCHAKDFKATQNPSHIAAGFPTDCSICHNSSNWTQVNFDHSRFTKFPLTGAHITVPCSTCHINNQFAGTPTDCYSCHAKDYNGTTNPNHKAAGFPTDCSVCHTTTSWAGATFDHSKTPFPLTGAHVTVPCSSCHINGQFAGTPTDCASCHIKDYNGTTNPNHKAAGFPTDCSICHTTASWAGATFDHSKTGFPLTGAHTTLSCSTCHLNGTFTGLSPACVSCHLKDYNGTTNPNHAAAGFPQQCDVCHTTTSWAGASFNHNNTPFPLTGAHVTVPCTSCHINNQFAGTPTDCYSCHKANYTSTTNPNHVAAAFPTTCDTCHTTTSWLGATFNHTWFPIYSGTHQQGVWTTCADCHTSASNYAVFSCINCHTHDKTSTDAHHQGVGGYVYSGTSCYSCHPQGSAGN